jgi:hypothetical protein
VAGVGNVGAVCALTVPARNHTVAIKVAQPAAMPSGNPRIELLVQCPYTLLAGDTNEVGRQRGVYCDGRSPNC